MNRDNKPRIIAAAATALAIALAIVVMCLTVLRYDPSQAPQLQHPVIEIEEEFVEVIEAPGTNEADALAQAAEQLPSQAANPSGTDSRDAGERGVEPKLNTSKAEQPVKVKKKEKTPEQIAREKKEKEEAEIKRKASEDIAGAFSNRKGKHANEAGTSDKGENGKPEGTAPGGTLTGRGTGKAGGGWSLPRYAPVASTLTGSVELEVTIARDGSVAKVAVIGGQAPAATSKQVQQACIAEVRSRRFTRANAADAPASAKAYITYNFR